jgi:DNA replication protein DnaC
VEPDTTFRAVPTGTPLARISRGDLARVVGRPAPGVVVEIPPPAVPLCELCGGAGWYKLPVATHDPRFGQLQLCECRAASRAERLREQLLVQSNLVAYADKTFASFNPRAPGVMTAFLRALDFAKDPCGALVLLGGYGCGKTHLAGAIAHTVAAAQRAVLFVVVPDLLDDLRAAFDPAGEGFSERFERVKAVELLILDDLGTESSTPWAVEKLYQLINYRTTVGAPLVVTSNRPARAIDGRIVSRLKESAYQREILTIVAPDYRARDLATDWPDTIGGAS